MLAGSLKERPYVAAAVRLVFDHLVMSSVASATATVPGKYFVEVDKKTDHRRSTDSRELETHPVGV